ncbi:hypothetical protein BO71DRAFT_437901 [Aspergillus ellipticus CBS 707.79]|uniref:Uncharacterized protein n=1 Tax=Aspergillus ellipticus CBS 707.79 TaxID=1448320 RepID=A0A319F280_9EURO|nr:hypothetical protein BO71DRAFT_437901 [Aspergillus ellipticus CBS 707.79]
MSTPRAGEQLLTILQTTAAVIRGYSEIVKLLLKHGADANAQGGEYGTAIQAAASGGHIETMQVLLERQELENSLTEETLVTVLKQSNAFGLMSLILRVIQADKIKITEEVLMAAAQNEHRIQLVALLLDSSSAISEHLTWARELSEVGYDCQDIINIFLEDKEDSPWIYFQPTHLPHSEIQPDRHIPQCYHLLSAGELRPMQNSDPNLKNNSMMHDHQEILHQIQEHCGLAGISPITRTMTDWVGKIEFNANDRALSVSYALPTDEQTIRGIGVTLSRIAQALEGIYQAAALMQAKNLCCNSFTVLKSGFQVDGLSPSPLEEIISIPLKLILDLLEELKKVINPASRNFETDKILSVSKKVLGYIWTNIPENPSDSNAQWCLHLCALSVQFLSLGCLSYSQAHIGPLRLFFLDFVAQKVRLMGFQREQSQPFLVAEMMNLTCLSGMARDQVLCFRASEAISGNQLLGSQHDIVGHVDDLLDTWGPGNLIVRKNDRSTVAIKIGDGFVLASGSGKFHWTQQMPDIKKLDSIDIAKPLLIGSLVSINAVCKPIEIEARNISANFLEQLGTTPSYWEKSQRQLAAQAGQYVVLQAAETYNKHPGIPEKDRALAYPPQELIQFLDNYWGVQVSYCTGVARRVRLRRLIADLMPHFFPASKHHSSDLEAKLRDETLQINGLIGWINGLSPDVHTETLYIISRILNTLRHTGLDPTDMNFCVAWPFQGSTTQCFKVPVEYENVWVRFLADSHDCAAFVYLTMDCFQTSDVRCKGTPLACQNIHLLETTVARIRREEISYPSALEHHETCFFSKQDSMFWVKVLKENMDQVASLVPLIYLQKLRYSLLQRLILSERKRQRSRLRETPTSFAQGEAVLVFSEQD